MRFGTECWTNLEDPLQRPDHDLLVELWALSEIGRPPEVVDGKDVGPALGRGLEQLRGRNFREALFDERVAKSLQRRAQEALRRAAGGMAQRHRRMIEPGRKLRGHHGPKEFHGRLFVPRTDHVDRRVMDFHP